MTTAIDPLTTTGWAKRLVVALARDTVAVEIRKVAGEPAQESGADAVPSCRVVACPRDHAGEEIARTDRVAEPREKRTVFGGRHAQPRIDEIVAVHADDSRGW